MSALPKFDNRAKNALAIAQQIAIQLGHNHIGSEHLLFGILSQPQEGLPFQMAFIDNISNQELLEIIRRQGFEKFQQKSEEIAMGTLLPEITQELQNCLDSAIRVAENFNYSYIGIEHLIYGILDTSSSHGQQIMNLTDSSSGKLKDILNSIFNSYQQGQIPDRAKVMSEAAAARSKKPRQRESALSFFTTNLNQKVSKEANFQVIQRDKELDRLVQILTRKNKNNPILLGEPGVGKTALVEGLAKRINTGKVPEWLQDKKILSLDIGNLIAGSVFRGEFEQRVKAIIDEVAASKDVILFIDEVHSAIGAGGGNNSGPGFSDILKPALARGEISVIGATTEDEFRTIIKKDKAFERRFQPIRLEEPDASQTVTILKGVKSMYENYHTTVLPDELVDDLVTYADRFIPERYFPDKAIDILDEVLVRCRIQTAEKNSISKKKEQEWVDIERQILDLIKQKNDAILSNNMELTKKFEDDQRLLEEKLSKLNVENKEARKYSVATKDVLEKVIAEVSGVPLVRISSNIFTQIKNLQAVLDAQIFGQKEATTQISQALKRSYAGVNPHKGPIASFLLLGPTGVGKTELVKVLTRELYGDPSKYMLKIDMSEFRERHQMSRLLGAPAGYVGYDDAPQLTEFLRKKPYSVILFDEIEKAHPENLNILLQMLDEGRVTDAKGVTVTCEHAMIFMTSNLGKNQLNKFASKLGFIDPTDKEEQDYQEIRKQVMEQVEKAIKPEILGRITSKIVFRPISKTVLRKIIIKELSEIQRHMLKQGRSVRFGDSVVDYLIEKASEKLEYGAREVKSLVAEHLQDHIAEYLLDHEQENNLEVSANKSQVLVKGKKVLNKVEEKIER
jgi:ATP-dependent Clp protease ATP-binding subunit ClpC